MIQATLRVVAPAGKCQEILEILQALTGPTEVTKGCRGCGVLRDADDGDAITYLVRWETRDELDEHFRSQRFRRVLPYIELSAEPPHVEVSSVEQIGGMEILIAAIGA